MKKVFAPILVSVLMVLGAFGDEAPKEIESKSNDLFFATWTQNHELFNSHCDRAMKDSMTAKKFAELSKKISPFMVLGAENEFMGVLKKGTLKVYYWKTTFSREGVPDMLTELTMNGDKVAAFDFR